jgi:GNAT superfamily N-acetyltransferase
MKVEKLTYEGVEKSYPCMHNLSPQFAFWEKFVPQSQQWLRSNLGKHVEGYHLLRGEDVVGHIYYAPSDKTLVTFKTEPKVAIIYCVWLERKYRGKGYGRQLFDAFKDEMRQQGYKGILVDTTNFPEFMHHSHFEKQSFKAIKEHGVFKFMYFPLTKEKVEVSLMKLKYKPTGKKVEVTLFKNFFCPVGVAMDHKIKEVAKTFGDKVKIVEMEATKETLEKYGTHDVLINGKVKLMGPASEEEIRKAIQEEIA